MQTVRQTWPLTDETLKPALELALAVEHAPMGVLLLSTEAADTLEPVLGEGLTTDQCTCFGHWRPGVGPFGIAFSEHRRVTVPDIMKDGDSRQMRRAARTIGFRALDVVPLTLDDGRTIGAMGLLFPHARIPSARSGRLAELAGRITAIALDNARLRADADRRRDIAESLAHARGQYVAKLGHELRTPLQSIMGYMELLRLENRGGLSSRQEELLDRVRDSARILINAMGDLGTMARLEAGRLDYLIVPVLAASAVATAVAVVAPLAQAKSITLTAAPSETALVLADETKLRQVLVNLLANAVKFTPRDGSVTIHHRVTGARVRFDIADTGPGIPAEKLDEVFQPFVQLADLSGVSPVPEIAGSGLGLAISREFAEGMHGRLAATSAPGHGSVFTLTLPKA
jgi:signal transduction histidine kinase